MDITPTLDSGRLPELAGVSGRAFVNEPMRRWLLGSGSRPVNATPGTATRHGRGIGRALIEAGLAKARADGTGAFLSTGTAANVTIYGRCGFRVYH